MIPILLDTHSWVWLVASNPHLKPAVRPFIEAAASANSVFVSPISMWEIALKHSRGKLDLDRPIRDWLIYASNLAGIQVAQITPSIAAECAALPSAFHGDPADRILAATARSQGLTLVTHDKALLRLSDRGFFLAMPT